MDNGLVRKGHNLYSRPRRDARGNEQRRRASHNLPARAVPLNHSRYASPAASQAARGREKVPVRLRGRMLMGQKTDQPSPAQRTCGAAR